MPTYSYRCAACGHEFERVQRITEDAIKTCPSCGADAASRLINSANFILKGGGWYSDLYSGGSNKKSGGSSAPSTPAATPSAPAATESSSSSAAPPPPPPSAPSSSGGTGGSST
ncbi:MAG: zinc ribbon domain-containing protein [Polyangiales bacterium]